MTKTQATSENWIAMAIFSMNMATALRKLLLSLLDMVKKWLKIILNLKIVDANSKIIPVPI
jgi:hypothetical protein